MDSDLGWVELPDQSSPEDVCDVDVLMQMIANEEAAVHRYEPYTPPHSDDACSPPSAATSFSASHQSNSAFFNTDADPTLYGDLWKPTKKRRRHDSPTNDYTTVLSIDNAAFQPMEQLDPNEIEAALESVLPALRTDLIKEEAVSPIPCQNNNSSCSSSNACQQEERVDESAQLKWLQHDLEQACCLCNERLQPLPAPKLHISADKGFSFSTTDDAFVNHRKNHFQLSVNARFPSLPSKILLPGGSRQFTGFQVHIHGIKVDGLNQKVMVEQSQTDRRKRPYQPVRVNVAEDGSLSATISRLHFSETTQNNHRKRGQPNPEQKYFKLIVGLFAVSGDQSFPLVGGVSERFIVRASNPKQFESETADPQWQPGTVPGSMCYKGRVGVNTSNPEESLTVQGNIKVSGQVLQPCDDRVKDRISEVNYGDQLKNMSGIRLHQYQYKDVYSRTVDIPPKQQTEIGVIAQEVRELLPDAVLDVGDLQLCNGERIENLLVVNKDRIFLESVGAVKELCKLTGNMESRLCDLEQRDRKFAKFARKFGGSLSSSSSSSSKSSRSSKASEVQRSKRPEPLPTVEQGSCCLMYRMKQEMERRSRMTIVGLLALIFFLALLCVSAITAAVLYSERSRVSTTDPKTNVDGADIMYISDGTKVAAPTTPTTTTRPVHDELAPATTRVVQTSVNCTMSVCRREACCGKEVVVPTPTEAQTPAPVKEVATTKATKYPSKTQTQTQAQPVVAADTPLIAPDPAAAPKEKTLPSTGMMADGAVVIKSNLKLRRRKRNSEVVLNLETECTVNSLATKSMVYMCPSTGMADRETVTIRLRSQCKLADVTCSCECRDANIQLQPQADCWSSALKITVTGDTCQP